MSIQQRLKEIADAIREKEKSNSSIQAIQFAQRILDIPLSHQPDGTQEISVTSNDINIGNVSGGGSATNGMTVTVSAIPISYNIFEGWNEDEKIVSKDKKYTFKVEKSRELKAIFQKFAFQNKQYQGTFPISRIWYDITYAQSKYVAVNYGKTGSVCFSQDLQNWTYVDVPAPYNEGNLIGITYGNGIFITYQASDYFTSSDAETWELHQDFKYISNITFVNGKFVALAGTNYQAKTVNIIATSSDGITWEQQTTDEAYWKHVSYGGGIYIISANSGYKYLYSYDLVNWTNQDISGTEGYPEVGYLAYGNGKFISLIPSSVSTYLYESSDGFTWKKMKQYSYGMANIKFGGGRFLCIPSYGNKNYIYCDDGENWIEFSPTYGSSYARLMALCYGNGKFVIPVHNFGSSTDNSNVFYYLI